jgi:CHASE2 domain-containing sensor protein
MSIRFLRYAGIGGFLIGGGTAILLYGGWVPSLPAVGFILAAVLLAVGAVYGELADLKAQIILRAVLAPETARDPAAED